MNNAFYFILKALFVLEIIHFCCDSKFMTSQTWQQLIKIHILPNISRNKDTQTMKFGQLIKYSVGNIFLQKSCIKRGKQGKVQDHFLLFKKAKSNWSGKSKGSAPLVLILFGRPWIEHTIKIKCWKKLQHSH